MFTIVITVIMCTVVCATLLVDKDDYSQIENRYLTEFSLKNLDAYLSDRFPYRTSLIAVKNKIDNALGKSLINGIYIGRDNYLIPVSEDFDKKEYIVKTINEFSRDKNVTTMFIPDSISINSDKLGLNLGNRQKEDLDYFKDNLDTNNIDIFDRLKQENSLTGDMYYLSDHHWTSKAAYVAYQTYCENMHINSEEKFTIKKIDDSFLGTSASKALGLASADDIYIYDYDNDLTVEYCDRDVITDSLYNYEHLSGKDKYSVFLDGNHSLIKISNNKVNDGSLLVVKNSYGNCFVPFVVNNYSNVYVVDLRYYFDSVSELINEYSIENILILYNLNNLYSDPSIIKLK